MELIPSRDWTVPADAFWAFGAICVLEYAGIPVVIRHQRTFPEVRHRDGRSISSCWHVAIDVSGSWRNGRSTYRGYTVPASGGEARGACANKVVASFESPFDDSGKDELPDMWIAQALSHLPAAIELIGTMTEARIERA